VRHKVNQKIKNFKFLGLACQKLFQKLQIQKINVVGRQDPTLWQFLKVFWVWFERWVRC
jgi:hypothetical protein